MNDPYGTDERDALRKTIAEFVRREITPNIDEWERAGEWWSAPKASSRRAVRAGTHHHGGARLLGGAALPRPDPLVRP
ncbi:acyl-CoA dehydrogenase family protein [Paractinoplanes brasiliensis]|uniref:acyl-CoA dehydrogenase family protein n=1 Tax=Paractinoplanes brasiliensis TaxID=52695 RepID=UPI00105C4CA1|nr:hypothetical protein Abr02nite_75050 [Actinoplanes brasiliensis]